MAFQVHVHATRILFWDQWDYYGPIFEGRGWTEVFFFQHSPHRQGLGNLLLWLTTRLNGWDGRWDSWIVVGTLVASVLVAAKLFRRLAPDQPWLIAFIPFFFLRQVFYESMLIVPNPAHGALPILLLLLAAWAHLSLKGVARSAALTFLVFLLVNTGFGFFGAAVVLFGLALQKDWRTLLPATLAFGTFFIGYRPGEYASDCVSQGFPSLMTFLKFVCGMLGKYFAVGGIRGFWLGLLILILMSAAAWIRRAESALPILGIVFSLVFAVASARGRSCLGGDISGSSRYQILLIPAYLALCLLIRRGGLGKVLVGALAVSAFILPAADVNIRDGFANGKKSWEQCYREKRSVPECDRITGFQVHPRPESTRLQEKLRFIFD